MSGANIKYSTIKQFKESGDYNFYGVIYDASLPKKEENSDNFVCCLKIIDPQVNCLNYKTNINDNCINLFIKSLSKENLPFIHCVGDIIRVHKGVYVNII
jgi:Telomeric single stranded DNA binding POT1/CDC13